MERDFLRIDILLCWCAVNQYTKITGTFSRIQTEEPVLRVNKSKITGENTFHGDHFVIGGNHGSGKDKKVLF